MPYVKALPRRDMPVNRSELAYEVSRLIGEYVGLKGLSYEAITDARGALEAARTEFDRRVAFPYEDTKIIEGGEDPFAIIQQTAYAARQDAQVTRVRRQLRREE